MPSSPGGDRRRMASLRNGGKVLWRALQSAGTARFRMNIFAIHHIDLNYTALCTQGGAQCGAMSGIEVAADLSGLLALVLSRIAQLDQRTALPDQCLHSAETDVRPPRRKSGFDPGRVKTFFLPQKLHATGRDPRRRDRLSIFLLSSLESIRAQPRTTLSDPNGHTARTTIHTPHARIAARSGLIPRRFITRVRL